MVCLPPPLEVALSVWSIIGLPCTRFRYPQSAVSSFLHSAFRNSHSAIFLDAKGKKGGAPTVTVSLHGRAPNRFLTLLVLLRVPTHVLTNVFTGHQTGGNESQHLLRFF